MFFDFNKLTKLKTLYNENNIDIISEYKFKDEILIVKKKPRIDIAFERNILNKLIKKNNDHIIKLCGFKTKAPYLYLVFERLFPITNLNLNYRGVIHILHDHVLNALDCMHNFNSLYGYCHCDIKLENIMIKNNNNYKKLNDENLETLIFILIDFDCAMRYNKKTTELPRVVNRYVGNINFCSIDAMHFERVTPRGDLQNFGFLLFYLTHDKSLPWLTKKELTFTRILKLKKIFITNIHSINKNYKFIEKLINSGLGYNNNFILKDLLIVQSL